MGRWLPRGTIAEAAESTVVARVYDAAGQRVYRATHGLCTTSGALYVLAISPLQSTASDAPGRLKSQGAAEEELWSWFEAVQVQAPGACFAIVWTHMEPKMPEIDGVKIDGGAAVEADEDKKILLAKSVMEGIASKLEERMRETLHEIKSREKQFLSEKSSVAERRRQWTSLRDERDKAIACMIDGMCLGLRYPGHVQNLHEVGHSATSKIEGLHRQMEEQERMLVPESTPQESGSLVDALASVRAEILRHCRPLLCTGA